MVERERYVFIFLEREREEGRRETFVCKPCKVDLFGCNMALVPRYKSWHKFVPFSQAFKKKLARRLH
jgi:hypothetical protein